MNQPEGVTHWEGPGLDAWRPWSAAQVADQLAGVTAPWCVGGGCAIDLWLGRQTRLHDDIEIAMPRAHFAEFRVQFALRTARAHVVGRRDGIPFLQPQCVLLFKAKVKREKDEADFRACLPHLDPGVRTWLADALAMVHADHPWIEQLQRGSTAIRG